MKKLLHERWVDFAKRMIYNGGLGSLTAARKDRLWSEVASFIENYRSGPVDGWDGEFCLCDSFREAFGETYGMDIAHFYSCPDGFKGWEHDYRGSERIWDKTASRPRNKFSFGKINYTCPLFPSIFKSRHIF